MELFASTRRWPGMLGCVAVITCSTLAPGQSLGNAGHLDPAFGTGGVFTTHFTQTSSTIANAAAIQSDGKIVVVGSTPNGDALLRLNTNGTLDSSWGTGGILNTNFGSLGPVVGIVIQPDRKIVASATGLLGGSVGRFNGDGSLDTSFGSGGFATTKSIDAGVGNPSALALQTDGKIIVTGFGLMGRYTSMGQLDSTFGSSGIAPLNSALATGIALQSDGKILITSGVGAPTQIVTPPYLPSPQTGAIARYNTDGSLDKSFGFLGQAACVSSAAAIGIQIDGKIVVAGAINAQLMTVVSGGITYPANQTGFGLVRFNTDGSIDTGFGTGGVVITGFGNSFPAGTAFALAIQSNGEIVVAGMAGGGNQVFNSASFALARYTTTGQTDTTFGTNGTVTTAISQGKISFVSTLVLQSDGKIVAAGNTGSPEGQYFVDNFAVARYLAK